MESRGVAPRDRRSTRPPGTGRSPSRVHGARPVLSEAGTVLSDLSSIFAGRAGYGGRMTMTTRAKNMSSTSFLFTGQRTSPTGDLVAARSPVNVYAFFATTVTGAEPLTEIRP